MSNPKPLLIALGAALLLGAAALPLPAQSGDDTPARLYVPYADLGAILPKDANVVVVEKAEFDRLVNAARRRVSDVRELGVIERADYNATVEGEQMRVEATLEVSSVGGQPIALPLPFQHLGLTSVSINGTPAPLGIRNGQTLLLFLRGTGKQTVTLTGTAELRDMTSGGLGLALNVPTAMAGEFNIRIPGDQEVKANVPVASRTVAGGMTSVTLTIGGHSSLMAVFFGNGSNQDQKAVLVSDATTTVRFTSSGQMLDAVFDIQTLRSAVRDFTFTLDKGWKITDVASPDLTTWSVTEKGNQTEIKVVMRAASREKRQIRISAFRDGMGESWTSPRLALQGADFQRGYLLVHPGNRLTIRSEKLTDALRQSHALTTLLRGMEPLPGRLYYHWGDQWRVEQELAPLQLRRESEEHQAIFISPDGLRLAAEFLVTAVGREMYSLIYELPPRQSGWEVANVRVGARDSGFSYRIDQRDGKRQLMIELSSPVREEGQIAVDINLTRVPPDWDWSSDQDGAAEKEVSIPFITSQADKVKGIVSVKASGDLEVAVTPDWDGLEPMRVGVMASRGLGREVKAAYEYETPATGGMDIAVRRQAARISVEAAGLVTATPAGILGAFELAYDVTRAGARTFYLLADKELGEQLSITVPGHRISSSNVVAPGADTIDLPAALAEKYNLWQVELDAETKGRVAVRVNYERRLPEAKSAVPLVRPVGAAQSSEVLAVQAQGELAVKLSIENAQSIDPIALPPFFSATSRILAAYQLRGLSDNPDQDTRLEITTTIHDGYAVPVAIAAGARFRTLVGADGSQQVEAVYNTANAGLQFMMLRLPEGAELWSVRIGEEQTRPQRDASGRLLLALPYSRKPVEVGLVFATLPTGGFGGLELAQPVAEGIKINDFAWEVYTPPGMEIASESTNLQPAFEPLPPEPALFRIPLPILTPLGTKVTRVFSTINTKLDEAQASPGSESQPELRRLVEADDATLSVDMTEELTDFEGFIDYGKPMNEKLQQHRLRVAGRDTLPVRLDTLTAGMTAKRYDGLQPQPLEVSLHRTEDVTTGWLWGFFLTLLIGLWHWRARFISKFGGLLVTAFIATLVAIWLPWLAHTANGVFWATLNLLWIYLLLAFCLGFYSAFETTVARRPFLRRVLNALAPVMVLALLPGLAVAGGPLPAGQDAVILPYADPANPDAADKVLVPYAEYVRLHNQANPDDPFGAALKSGEISLAGLAYTAELEGQMLRLVLTGRVANEGDNVAELPMSFGKLAISEATLGTAPLPLQQRENGAVLLLPPKASGQFRVVVMAPTTITGQRGSVELQFPPLPAPVLKLQLADPDLEVEAPGLPGVPTKAAAADGAVWTIPLGTASAATISWVPKDSTSAADKTLTAQANHNVYLYHWAMIGVSRINFQFSAGENDRFRILVPEDTTLTSVTGANLKDVRELRRVTQAGQRFRLVEIRLHRLIKKDFALDLRWVRDLPKLGDATALRLPEADGVGRESGRLTLHAAKSLEAKIDNVTGGRRTSLGQEKIAPTSADKTTPLAAYTWPFRPFGLELTVTRKDAEAAYELEQLVRITRDSVQLLVNADLTAESGQLFGADFLLPEGYELLSVLGKEVERFHVREAEGSRPRVLHVDFRSAVESTSLALVLLNDQAEIATLPVPILNASTEDGQPLEKQKGQLAVQVAPALDAQTRSSEGLKAMPPSAIGQWLEAPQRRSVQFAYSYGKPEPKLELTITARPTTTRVNLLAGVAVDETSAWYTYRLRYVIDGSPIDELRFRLPTAYADLAAVTSPAMRSSQTTAVGEETEWTVQLTQEISGTVDVLVNFALPIGTDTRELPIPRLTTESNDGFEAIIALQNLSRHQLALQVSDDLQPMGIQEQRRVLERSILEHVEEVRRTFDPEWTASLKITPAPPAGRSEGVIDIMELRTVIDEAGAARYEAEFSLVNRSEQFLEIDVPKPLELWSASVDGRQVKPVLPSGQTKGGRVLIPLTKTSMGGIPYQVKLYFAGTAVEPLRGGGWLKPPPVKVANLPVKQTTWTLFLPENYKYTDWAGNMSAIAGTAEIMSLNIDAKLSQLSRMVDFNVLSKARISSAKSKEYYYDKLDEMQSNIDEEIRKNERYITENSGQLKQEDVSRLRGKIAQQRELSKSLDQTIRSNVNADQDAANDLSGYLRGSSGNKGVAEAQRNSALLSVPNFVDEAQSAQLETLKKELVKTSLPIVQAKLRETIIPQVNFENLDLRQVAEFLTAKSKELDPQGQGVRITVSAPRKDIANKVTLSLNQVPLSEILRFVSTISETGVLVTGQGVDFTSLKDRERDETDDLLDLARAHHSSPDADSLLVVQEVAAMDELAGLVDSMGGENRMTRTLGFTATKNFVSTREMRQEGKTPQFGDITVLGRVFKSKDSNTEFQSLAINQMQLEQQYENLNDNRMLRMYNKKAEAKPSAKPQTGTVAFRNQQAMEMAQKVEANSELLQTADAMQLAEAANKESVMMEELAEEAAAPAPPADEPSASAGGIRRTLGKWGRDKPAPAPDQLVATGVTSLPVTLPTTGTQLDFACPGGLPDLSIEAEKIHPRTALGGTAYTLLVFAALYLIYRFVRMVTDHHRRA